MTKKILTRLCPVCAQKIIYNSRGAFYFANNHNSKCKKCYIESIRGYGNPFFGKHHTEETKNKISDFNSKERILSEEFIQKARENLSKVSNKKPVYKIWLEKYGKEVADKKFEEMRVKNSIAFSGNKNPMFGKPAPQGSGNGWSGWYKEWFFRSIKELSYMILVIEEENLKWKTPDKNFKIPYTDFNGKTRNYFPDFIIEDSIIIEIKPKKLHNSPKVLMKKEGALKFCKENGFIYNIIDPPIISIEKLIKLYKDGEIRFLEKYDDKFRNKYLEDI
jgi:hypothetical protein